MELRSVLFLIVTLALLGVGIGSADVVINEMLPHATTDWYPNGEIGDMNDEFIELYNTGDEDVDVTNYTLMDISYRRSPGTYTFPEGFIIPAQEFLVLYSVESGVFQGNNGDGIMLNDSSGNLVDEKRYDRALGGDVSFVRIPDGSDWNTSFQPTPGEPNVQASMIRAVHLSSEKESLSFGVDDLPAVNLEFGDGSPYHKVAPGLHKVELIDPEDGTILLDLELDLDAETKTTLFVRDLSNPIIVKDATGMPDVKTSWLRFVNLVSDPVDVTLPVGGKIWFDGEKSEVEEGGHLFKDVEFGDVTDYVAAYSSDLDVAIILAKEDKSILVDELELEDEGVYTFVLVEDPKTLEKVLVLY